MKYSASALRERVELLDFTLTETGWGWAVRGEVWAGVSLTGKTCLFSKLGIGARAAEVTLRRRPLTLHQALRWRGVHLFLSEIAEPAGRGWLDVSAAVVELTQCRARAPEAGPVFPAVLTEKYLGNEQRDPMAKLTAAYVMVTPKTIGLKEGGLVEVGVTAAGAGDAYKVLVCHSVDPYKNEYEIVRKRDA